MISSDLARQDPLDVIPALVPVKNGAAGDILALVGECCSAKEVIVAVQESVERVGVMMSTGSDEDEAENDARRSPASQLGALISLYTSCEFYSHFLNYCTKLQASCSNSSP